MSDPTSDPNGSPVASAPPPASPQRPGCVLRLLTLIGRLMVWLWTIAVTLAAGAALLWWAAVGPLAAPEAAARWLPAAATAYAAQQQAQATAAALETALRSQSAMLDEARERVDALEVTENGLALAATAQALQVATISSAAQDVARRADQVATTQALAEADQITRAVMATMQVVDSRRIDTLAEQTERLNRFVNRLGDLAAALGAADPLPSAAPAAATPTAAAVTATAAPALTPTAVVRP
jgi:hypothetical protein